MKFLLLLLGSILLSLAHPFHFGGITLSGAWWTFLLASLGLLLYVGASVDTPSPGKRFARAFLGGLVYFSITLYWIVVALHDFGEINYFVSILACLLLAAYCSSFYGLWALLAGCKAVRNKPALLKIFCWAASFASFEAARQWLFTGFGWGELGFAFHFSPGLAGMSGFWGVHGLTFFWIFIVAAILEYEIWLQDSRQLKLLAICIVVFVVLGLSGAMLPRPIGRPISQTVSIIQPNIAQEMKWDPQLSNDHLTHLVKMSEAVASDQPQLIVWPETSYPFLLSATQRQFPVSTKVPLLIGAVVRDQQFNRNSAVLVSDQQIVGRFDKIHLVPFGEFVPLKDWIPFGKLVANAGDFIPGSKNQALLSPPGSKLILGPLICYEDVFQRESVRHAKRGANLLVNLTNDAWYGNTSAQPQHAAMAAMMVHATRLPMVRATNNGISTLITPTSREDLQGFSVSQKSFQVAVYETPAKTFFVWTYPLMEWIWPLIFVIALLWKESRQTKKIFFRK